MIKLGAGVRVEVNNLPKASKPAQLLTGVGFPDSTAFPVGTEYLDRSTGDVFQLGETMVWEFLINIKGEPGDTILTEAEREALMADLIDEAAQNISAPIDPVLLFENALL